MPEGDVQPDPGSKEPALGALSLRVLQHVRGGDLAAVQQPLEARRRKRLGGRAVELKHGNIFVFRAIEVKCVGFSPEKSLPGVCHLVDSGSPLR